MQWYYGVNNTQFGPVEESEIRSKIQSGELRPTDRVWREGMVDWVSCSAVPEFSGVCAPGLAVQVPMHPVGGAVNSPYAPPQSPGSAYPQGGVQSTSGLAIGALVMGILGLLVCQLVSIGGVVCGHLALSEIRRSEGRLGGRGMAIAGLVVGYIGVAIIGVAILLFGFALIDSASR